jgi:Ca2+-binding EF-hand superfamily protein
VAEELNKLRGLFDAMDLDKNGVVDSKERAAANRSLNEIKMEFGLGAEVELKGDLTFHEFRSKFVREWEVALNPKP